MEVGPHFSENAKNDFQLVEKARAGDQRAYAALMKRYKDSIYFMALKMVNNKEDAMDITVETFAKAFAKLVNYKSTFAFSTWLFRIATNNCIDFLRRKKLETTSLDELIDSDDQKPKQIPAEDPNPEEFSIKKQSNSDLKVLIDSLPQRHRNLITLRYYDELSYDEIAQQLSLAIGTVKAQLFKAKNLLSNIINSNANDVVEIIYKYFPEITDQQKRQFAMLKGLYEHWNAKINVVSRKDIEQLYERHVLHSLAIAKVVTFMPGEKVLDVGTGGGFPGIPLAILFPETEFYLVDSIGKKIKVVHEVAAALGLKNVNALYLRAEHVNQKFNFVISRAVTRLKEFYPWVKNQFDKSSLNTLPNGILYLKGGDLTEEIEEAGLEAQCNPISSFFSESFFDTKQVVYVKHRN